VRARGAFGGGSKVARHISRAAFQSFCHDLVLV
jgi:hypothetical protein